MFLAATAVVTKKPGSVGFLTAKAEATRRSSFRHYGAPSPSPGIKEVGFRSVSVGGGGGDDGEVFEEGGDDKRMY
ncbi:hypothetical protein HPP92_007819 [Vanilla planifolia]|uniref:Uncharacterized protein n=1 Tax=Vanilla planifolia TaxID=51239 RepID=A0A835REX2_VANPL|nr:hypothetical protein HPP92_007819 [Vanilla planifolia]